MALRKSQQSLKAWGDQRWRTKSGNAEYARTTAAKRRGKAQGKQFVQQPKGIAAKTRSYRQKGK